LYDIYGQYAVVCRKIGSTARVRVLGWEIAAGGDDFLSW